MIVAINNFCVLYDSETCLVVKTHYTTNRYPSDTVKDYHIAREKSVKKRRIKSNVKNKQPLFIKTYRYLPVIPHQRPPHHTQEEILEMRLVPSLDRKLAR